MVSITPLILLASLAITLLATANVTYAPPPPINVTQLLTLTATTSGQNVGSNRRIQGLQVQQGIDDSGLPFTNFTLNFFNRAAPSHLKQYSINREPGNWTYLTGTRETLSCNVLYESTTSSIGLLLFESDLGVFKIFVKIPLTDIKALLPAPYNNLSSTDVLPYLVSNFVVAEECAGGNLFGVVFSLQVYSDPPSLSVIKLPTGWNVQAASPSLIYGISQNTLYKYDPNTNQYKSIYTLAKYQMFTMVNVENRLIICGANSTNISEFQYRVIQTIYFFDDESTGLVLLGTVQLDGYNYGKIIQISTSPQLTKMGFGYTPVNQQNNASLNIVAKSIDYTNNIIVDLIFNDLKSYLETLQGMKDQFEFSDYFFAVRNCSGLQNNPGAVAVEEAYQFVGNQIIRFARRILTENGSTECVRTDTTGWRKIYVDRYFTSTLVVLDVYQTPTGYQIMQVEYGNYAATVRVVPPPIQAFLQFPYPGDSLKIVGSGNLIAFVDLDASNPTKITTTKVGANIEKYVQVISKVLPSTFIFIEGGPNCQILQDTQDSKYYTYVSTPNNANYTLDSNLSNILASASIAVNANTQWIVSNLCERIAINQTIIYRTATGTYSKISNTGLVWAANDLDLVYLASKGNGSTIWKFNSAGRYDNYYTNPSPFLPQIQIRSTLNKLVIVSLNKPSYVQVQILAFADGSGQLSNCFNYSANFTLMPNIDSSENLTKILINGPVSGPLPFRVDIYSINYAAQTNTSIAFPTSSIRDFAYTEINVYEKFIYVRQLGNPSQSGNSSYTSIPQMQFVYFLSNDVLPQQLLNRNIAANSNVIYKHNTIITTPDQHYFLLILTINTVDSNQFVVMNKTELNPLQANLNSGTSGSGVSGFVLNGSVVLCSPGCSDCSTSVCTGCKTSFAFNPNTYTCVICTPGCSACSYQDPTSCSGCLNGTYLSGTTCLPCNPTCTACVNTATNCLSCPPGQFFDSSLGQCGLCGRNCMSCKNGTCQACNYGFVLTNEKTCRGCSVKCAQCDPTNIMTCTSCSGGLQLVGTKCVNCPNNCQVCNNNLCQTCVPGYQPNSAGSCVLNCNLQCATCADNQPSSCLSCYSGSYLVGSSCALSTDCNATSTCTSCGQGLNYYLLSGNCFPCSNIAKIPNCIQCDQDNQQICSICMPGNYVNSGVCAACPSSCTNCIGASICTACQLGYTLPSEQTQGQCLACVSPCATCLGSTTYCTSCVSGYTKMTWKCQSNNYIGFTITLNQDLATTLNGIDIIVTALLVLMGQNSTNVDAITFYNIVSGSSTISGAATPSAPSSSPTAQSGLLTGLGSGSLGGIGVTSSSIVAVSDQQSSQSKKSNIGLIVGLAIGLSVFVAIIVIVAVYCIYKRKNLDKVDDLHRLEQQPGVVIAEQSTFEVNVINVKQYGFEKELA